MSYAKKFAILLFTMAMALPASGARAEKLSIGYIPIIPMTQLFVMEGEGWTKENRLELELTRFSSGPAMVQALASGKMDAVYFGIGPAMVARTKGIKIKVVAAGIVEQIATIARGPLVDLVKKHGVKEGLLAFTRQEGRKPKIASLPKGSVPDTVARHWILNGLGLSLDDVELVGMGASRVQQALLAGSVDAAAILEPILTIVQERVPDAHIIARASDMLPNQPGSVLAVREEALADKRAAIETLVRLHVRATGWIKEDPKRAAKHVLNFVAKGLAPLETIEKAMLSPSSNFEANPHAIIEATRQMNDFQLTIGAQEKSVDIGKLFDTSIYDNIAK